MIKYGKSTQFLFNKNKNFENNDILREIEENNIQEYKKAEKREFCINCGSPLNKVAFIRKEIKYFHCTGCSHLNGEYQNTKKFNDYLYNAVNYDSHYLSCNEDSYLQRVKNIYLPKAQFLIETLSEIEDPKKLSYYDFGCGSGYFVYAMTNLGFDIKGVDISSRQIDLGKNMLSKLSITNTLHLLNQNSLNNLSTDVLCLIGILEHLENPNSFMEEIDKKNIKYIYTLVPMFSLSNYLQLAFPEVYERLLASGHTHLYTENSLKSFFQKYDYEPIGEWWFGTDTFDLFRNFTVMLQKSDGDTELFQDYFKDLIDDMQLCIDKKHKSSEVHMIFKKRS